MKNLVLIVILFSSLNLFAQDKETLLGVKVGATMPGTIHLGGILDHSFNKNIGMTAEVLFNQKKTDVPTNIAFVDSRGSVINTKDLRYTFNYLQLPIGLKFSIGNKVKPYFNPGLAVGYLLTESSSAEGLPAFAIKHNNIEWSYFGGIGIDYKPIFIELRYNASINPSVTINNAGTIENYYNKSLMFSIGFKF